VAAAIEDFASPKFLHLPGGDFVELCGGIRPTPEDRFIHHPDSPGSNCSHGEFFKAGQAEFAHYKYVEWNSEDPRNLVSHGNSAARECEDDHVGAPSVISQKLSEEAARFDSIAKYGRHGAR
jgi:hypothetical protein